MIKKLLALFILSILLPDGEAAFSRTRKIQHSFIWQDEGDVVTQDIWKQKSDQSQGFDDDFIAMIQTMFPTNAMRAEVCKNPQQKVSGQVVRRENFIKRMSLLLLMNPPLFRPSGTKTGWPIYDKDIPCSSYLMRGGRWNIDITGSKAGDVLKILTDYDSSILESRIAASHGAIMEKNGTLVEEKLSGLKAYKAILHGLWKRHFGLNIPLGGYGNPAYNGKYTINFDGTALSDKKTQHGHVYMFLRTFGKSPVPGFIRDLLESRQDIQINATDVRSIILLGIEPSAPGKKSMFAIKHSTASAFKNTKSDPSLTNSQKWQKLDIPLQPQSYGGIISYICQKDIEDWEKACQLLLSLSPHMQRQFFTAWLRLSADELQKRRDQMLQDLESYAQQDEARHDVCQAYDCDYGYCYRPTFSNPTASKDKRAPRR